MTTPTRPIARYHGGKWRLAPWIIAHMPTHRIYVEPFGGAASVLLRKPRSYAEIYNDLDEEVVNLFRVLRDPDTAAALEHLLYLTPFSRVEFEEAYVPAAEDAVEQARRTLVKAYMGYGSNAIHATQPKGMRTAASTWMAGGGHTGFLTQTRGGDPTGFRVMNPRGGHEPAGFAPKGGWGYAHECGFRPKTVRSGSTHATDWARYPQQIRFFCERLAGVVIECRPALEVIIQHDRPDALFYCDPPYPACTRDAGGDYRHEMTDDDHRELAAALHQVQGMVLISGYPCALYDELYADWRCASRETYAEAAKARTECLWLNPAAASRLHGRLFEEEP